MAAPLPEYLAESAMLSFAPINAIHQHLSGLHCYAQDRTSVVSAHHFCSCLKYEEGVHKVRQCVIYDSDRADARLIGVEYVVSEDVFLGLPEEEKKYWHSHKYEVESGQLTLKSKNFVPVAAEDLAERSVMKELQTTYGKTIHTWRPEVHPDLPLGPPSLMMSFTGDDQVDPSVLATRDRIEKQDTAHKRLLRSGYLDTSYKPAEGCDAWSTTGKGIAFEPREVDVAMPKEGTGEMATWKGKVPLEEVLGGSSAA
ncbi:hypothetical protein JCM8115_001013 [Rhodotorula mucilaginosa]